MNDMNHLNDRPTFHSKLWNLKKKSNRILRDITSLDIVGRLPSVFVKLVSVVGLIIQPKLCTVQKPGSFIPNNSIYCCQLL